MVTTPSVTLSCPWYLVSQTTAIPFLNGSFFISTPLISRYFVIVDFNVLEYSGQVFTPPWRKFVIQLVEDEAFHVQNEGGFLTGYLSVDPDDSDMHCPIEHSEFYYPEEWLMEIYSAYPDDPERFPDDASVMETLSTSERETIEDAGGPVAYLERRYGITIDDPRRPAIPDPLRCAINRRAV